MIKIFKFIANLLLMVVIAALSAYFLLRVTNKIEIYNVKTGSMEAKIHVGDYILIYKKSDYNVGDVVTYTSNNGFITHRIIKKDGDKVVTKGDANNTEDETISAKIIVGKVVMSGGILNIVIKYKYVLSGIVLSLYLFSCYFESSKDDKLKNNNDDSDNNIKDAFLQLEPNDDIENKDVEKNESEEVDKKNIEENNVNINNFNEIKKDGEEDKNISEDVKKDTLEKINEEVTKIKNENEEIIKEDNKKNKKN